MNADQLQGLRNLPAYPKCFCAHAPDLSCRPDTSCGMCDSGCELLDLDGDQAIDSRDLAALLPRLTGPQ